MNKMTNDLHLFTVSLPADTWEMLISLLAEIGVYHEPKTLDEMRKLAQIYAELIRIQLALQKEGQV
jgi:hypothetical protein